MDKNKKYFRKVLFMPNNVYVAELYIEFVYMKIIKKKRKCFHSLKVKLILKLQSVEEIEDIINW